jgi:hypothetical protein
MTDAIASKLFGRVISCSAKFRGCGACKEVFSFSNKAYISSNYCFRHRFESPVDEAGLDEIKKIGAKIAAKLEKWRFD